MIRGDFELIESVLGLALKHGGGAERITKGINLEIIELLAAYEKQFKEKYGDLLNDDFFLTYTSGMCSTLTAYSNIIQGLVEDEVRHPGRILGILFMTQKFVVHARDKYFSLYDYAFTCNVIITYYFKQLLIEDGGLENCLHKYFIRKFGTSV